MAKEKVQPEVTKGEDGIDNLTQAAGEPVEIYGAKKVYVEWDVKIEGGKAEKLKAGRKVKITDEQADILNQGVTEGGNTYAKMYFPEEKK